METSVVARENPKVHPRKGTQLKESALRLRESRLEATTNDSRDGGYGNIRCLIETGGTEAQVSRNVSSAPQVMSAESQG